MVKKPVFKITRDGTDVTEEIKSSLLSLRFNDERGVKADQLVIRLSGEQDHWNKGEDIVFSMGYEGQKLWRFGTFRVLASKSTKTGLTVRATGVDFSSTFRQPKSRGWEGLSLGGIVKSIASENNLDAKTDFDDFQLPHFAQANESDMEFLARLAEKYDAMYNIKNGMLLFIRSGNEDAIKDELPVFKIDASKAETWEVERNARNEWKSCRAIGQDLKTGQKIEYLAGSGEPKYQLEYSFQNAVEAKEMAWATLRRLNRGARKGVIETDGDQIYAWGYLDVTGTREDDKQYSIKAVDHTFSFSRGWKMRIEFEA